MNPRGLRFDGKVVVLAGAATGIGAAAAQRFLDEGASVMVGDRNAVNGGALAESLACSGREGRVAFTEVDVSDEAQVGALIDATVSRFGQIDVMFNNAGFAGAIGPLVEMDVDHFDETFAVMVRGVFLGIKHAAIAMIRQGWGGSIVNTASIGGLAAGVPPLPYSATKSAVVSITQNAAAELAHHRIRVNAVCPGIIFTDLMHRGRVAEAQAVADAIQPWPDRGEPEHVASAVAYLASDDAAFVTGEAHVVDGGYLANGLLAVHPLPGGSQRPTYSGITRGNTGLPAEVRRIASG
ncbi:MAG TPA: glucose 1-dehydrogenase [Acidimicrobiia bacterium]|nr:glucose 1-dehydrogenase [Acidimicrobiia bacterium]